MLTFVDNALVELYLMRSAIFKINTCSKILIRIFLINNARCIQIYTKTEYKHLREKVYDLFIFLSRLTNPSDNVSTHCFIPF